MLDRTVGNASVLTRRLLRWWAFPLLVSTRHLPSRTLSLFFRHIHFTLPLLLFLLLFAAVHAAILISLVRDFSAAFPHARTLYVSALVTVPTWGFAMCALHLLSTARTPLSSYLGSRARGERWRYAPLRDTYNLEAASEHDSKYRSSHYATVSAADDDQDRPPPKWTRLWLGYLTLGLLGFYMLCTYALPGDHRFKGVVDLARRQPRRDGYGNGGALRLLNSYSHASILISDYMVELEFRLQFPRRYMP
ncbi:hypothetical protein C8R43DRAFT_622324 [Mycena crocata]|nr:hypothetical protein C8R43DRAFT_622324 [Mycena crocata]